ncbi:hypothetical protein C5C42_14725 [Rathayibacter sp. AY1F7]|nr:hypothetical protein C5C54_16305 [Rathayibacter sp. AY1F2]PPH42754.1 hypothetical protein C5C42_14725 [Rathayibacter sp. AY1F7]
MADLPPEERPRERLRAYGPEALTDAETLAVLIGAGVRGANATVVAQRLLARFGGIDAVARAGVGDLMGTAESARSPPAAWSPPSSCGGG